MLDHAKFVSELEGIAETVTIDEQASRGWHIDARLQGDRIPDAARLLLSHGFYLCFVTAVHVSPSCDVIYQFGHFEASCRVILRTSAGADKSVPSIAPVYHGAAWHEREAHEFFGLTFTGHPHLKPLILSREERGFHPLLKDEGRLKSYSDIFEPKSPPQEEQQ